MNSPNNPNNSPRLTFEGICAKYGLTLEDLASLREAVDQALPNALKAAGITQGLTWEHILTLEGLGDKSVSKLLENVEKSKGRPLPNVLFALGIRHVGLETAQALVRRFGSLEVLAKATEAELAAVPGIGPKIAASVATYFRQEKNRRVLEKLKLAGVRMEAPVAVPQDKALPLEGKQLVVTGRLASLSRSQAEDRIKELGGSVGSNVTRKTAYLVVGEEPGSKLEQANSLGTPVLNEEQFLELLEGQLPSLEQEPQ